MHSALSPKTRPPEAGLLEIPGNDSRWIWAFTCPTPGCACRTAILLSTSGGREALIAQGAPVRDAWTRGDSYAEAAPKLSDVTAFVLDIDEGGVSPIDGDAPFDLDAHPGARDVVDRIDGEVLETIGRLWYRGKGWPDPEEKTRQAAAFKIEGWQPGDMVAWGDMLVGVRQDIYRFGERAFEANEMYCVAQGCTCGEVLVDFTPLIPRGAPAPGAIRVAKSGAATFEPAHERHRERLKQLWAAFQERHPCSRDRFASRAAVMQEIAPRVVGASRADIEKRTARVGRNDPCPCGSGKKYKKCCGGG